MTTRAGKLEEVVGKLKDLSEKLATEEASQLSSNRARQIRDTIRETCERLQRVIENLDPVKRPDFIFDPSSPNVLGRIVAITMIAQPRKPLAKVERFYGSGVYALYYSGAFPAYRAISKQEHPIYVGKADPADATSNTAVEQGQRLSSRLNDHRKNIEKASTTLRVEDFECRALVVQSGWQTPAEDYLISLFKPIWNSEVGICYGFGKHGDDPGTRANLRSPWDTLHKGRDWAHRNPDQKDAHPSKRIIDRIAGHFEKYPPIGSIDEILRRFIEEMRGVS